MSFEQPTNSDPEKLRLAEEFRAIVNSAIAPELAARERGVTNVHGFGVDAKAMLSYGSDKIYYCLFKESEVQRQGGGVQWLNFIPSHMVEILCVHPFFERNTAQATFGLREDGTIVRNIKVSGRMQISMIVANREFNNEQSQALIDYISAPHLNLDKRDIIFALTPDEEAKLAADQAQDSKAAAKLQADLEALDRSRRPSFSDLNTNRIG